MPIIEESEWLTQLPIDESRKVAQGYHDHLLSIDTII